MDLNATRYFVKIVQMGSISAAARVLNLPKATLSRQLSALEQRLGNRLLNRSTRALSLTDLGQEYYASVVSLIDELELAEQSLLQQHAEPAGLIRIGATTGYCQHRITPLLPGFLTAYPRVRIELKLSEQRSHVVQDGLDLTIRMGELADSELLCRKIGTVRRILCAAPAYLAKSETLVTPDDLRRQQCVVLSAALDKWQFENNISVSVNWQIAAGNMSNACQLVLAGQGIGLLPDFMVAEYLATGQLLSLLPDYPASQTPVHVLYANSKAKTTAAMAFVDYLVSALR
ncbi:MULTISPECIES: LysR family transcriptional regulator [Alishewanella]|uniref:LysR family transcriptional regulator n=1 Tax=Alishewanella aestuarii B11 TaxID=1197174 RepID=J1YDW3_9ALTE|nr:MULTISPECIES: LysR family transcriptional regulator [Alishewanella]EJI86115.1 LysR family transcriptional regulator [Alishewanella aestuarii B11]OCW95387.1 LysR family transcriptional regulator [Alishewanella sp. HH-ZS]